MAILVVTHDVDEALALADRIVVMDGGRMAHEWEITARRDDRAHTKPEIARLRAQLLEALGVQPTPPNPNRNQLENQGAA